MPLEAPHDDAGTLRSAFPCIEPPIDGRWKLWRIGLTWDPATARRRSPFFFASAPADPTTGGRYDLPEPDGACYLAVSGVGAWLEVFRGTRLVELGDLRARHLVVTSPPREVPAADLAARGARRFGITGEIHTTSDYAVPRLWSRELHRAGFRALVGRVRHDPGLREMSVTLLDRSGSHHPYGWRWRVATRRLDTDTGLLAAVAVYGFRVAEIPFDMPVDENE